MLLVDLRKVFHQAADPVHLPTGNANEPYDPIAPAILPALIAMEGHPWSEYSRSRPLSPRGLANLLKRFKINPGTIRLETDSTPKGYKRADLEPIWERYGIGASEPPNLSATTPHSKIEADFSAS